MFRPKKYLNKTRIKQQNTLELPTLLQSSDNWTIETRETRRIRAAEMKCKRKTAGYTWTDYKPNTQFAKQINTIQPQFWSAYRNTEETVCNIQTKCRLIDYQE